MSTQSSINTLLTGALLLAGSAAFAQTTPDAAPLQVAVYETTQTGKVCLLVGKQPDAFAFVQLLASTGEELCRVQLLKKGIRFRQVFDLHELKDGTYRLRIKQGKNIIVKSIQWRTNTPDPALATRLLTLGE